MRVKFILAAGTSLLVGACGIARHGYVYSAQSRARGHVVFPDSVGNRGEVRLTLPDGERCSGRYSTIPGPQVTFDDQEIEIIYEEDTQDGMAVLDCKAGHLLRCNLSRDILGAGVGHCVDNRGRQLSMYF